ncbi:MAG: UPF0175 family protein [bacterium]|nr:UPF0175 family protein [bacterium]
MTVVEVAFETDVFSAVRKSPAEVAREIRVATAIYWYARGLVSQGKAAEIAGLSRAELIDALEASGVSACQQTLEDIDEEVKVPRSRRREHEWRRLNRDALARFEGQWVVLEGEEIVVRGEDPVRLVEQAREKGVEEPYVFRVERTQPDIVKIGL